MFSRGDSGHVEEHNRIIETQTLRNVAQNDWTETQTYTKTLTAQAETAAEGWVSRVFNRITSVGSPYDIVARGIRAVVIHGSASVDASGSALGVASDVNVQGTGDPLSEFAAYFGVVRMGTDTKAANGRVWVCDLGGHGPIGAQPNLLTGVVSFLNNYYEGSPSAGPSSALIAVTKKGAGPAAVGAGHNAADTYPLDVGVSVAGRSRANAVDGIGWTVGVKVGGSASGWMAADESSIIGTGVEVTDYVTAGVHVHGGAGPAALLEGDVEVTGDLILAAPNGARYVVGVSNAGTLTVTPAQP